MFISNSCDALSLLITKRGWNTSVFNELDAEQTGQKDGTISTTDLQKAATGPNGLARDVAEFLLGHQTLLNRMTGNTDHFTMLGLGNEAASEGLIGSEDIHNGTRSQTLGIPDGWPPFWGLGPERPFFGGPGPVILPPGFEPRLMLPLENLQG